MVRGWCLGMVWNPPILDYRAILADWGGFFNVPPPRAPSVSALAWITQSVFR